ncbi:tripartite tricarboxylate transporter substrate binding protein [Synergistaceae bacterium OttesenSCG-928-I11]|nr:tripartite tricarboxylate transporter substrate binding protein [Synergistaceae bacterium OttesenSCG-928-I11]
MTRRTIAIILAILAVALSCGYACAATNDWKWERSVEIVCPFGLGSGPDISLRAIQPALEKELGVPVIVNNRPGSAGLVGNEFFIRQPADGYSYMIITTSIVIHEVNKALSYSILKDCVPICILNQDDYILVAGKEAPYNDLLELAAYAKDKPGKVTVACESMGGTDEFLLNALMKELGIELRLVPFSGASESVSSLMGGFVDLIIGSPGEVGAYIESGNMKGLGVLNETRNAIIPDVKSVKEMGLDTTYFTFRGIVARKDVPQAAIDSIRKAFANAAQSDTWKEWIANNGLKSDGFAAPEALTEAYTDRIEMIRTGKESSSSSGK